MLGAYKSITLPVTTNRHNSLSYFLVMYFNSAFLLFHCPFRLRRAENGLYIFEKNVVQTSICAVSSCLAIVYLIGFVRARYVNTILQDNTSPLRYFQLLNTVFVVSLQILTIKSFWFTKHRFLYIVNFIQSNSAVFSYITLKVCRYNTEIRLNFLFEKVT